MTWDAQPRVELPLSGAEKEKKKSPWLVIILCLFLFGILAVLGFLAYGAYSIYALPGKVAKEVRTRAGSSLQDLRLLGESVSERLRGALKFSPTVVVGDRVVVNGFSNVAHWVLNEAEFTQERQFSHTFLGSTKRLEISGDFRSRAGINLARESHIEMSPEKITVVLPRPEVLSVELRNLDFVQDRDGLWNRIQPEEREFHVNQLVAKARETADAMHPPEQLEKRVREMLLDVIRPLTDAEVVIVFEEQRSVENPLSTPGPKE
jgi:hypothetical protein